MSSDLPVSLSIHITVFLKLSAGKVEMRNGFPLGPYCRTHSGGYLAASGFEISDALIW